MILSPIFTFLKSAHDLQLPFAMCELFKEAIRSTVHHEGEKQPIEGVTHVTFKVNLITR